MGSAFARCEFGDEGGDFVNVIHRLENACAVETPGAGFDVVVTVCGSADERCPAFPGARIVHVGFDDPPRLAKDAASDDEAMPHYRRVRDEIRSFIERLPDAVGGPRHS